MGMRASAGFSDHLSPSYTASFFPTPNPFPTPGGGVEVFQLDKFLFCILAASASALLDFFLHDFFFVQGEKEKKN